VALTTKRHWLLFVFFCWCRCRCCLQQQQQHTRLCVFIS